jgi:hypothetical protein
MLKEDIDIAQAVKQEINKVIDAWVNDLIINKIATPQISPERQMSLWDRLKGSMSNIFYGRYKRDNPNYWRNRFGDDLGVQEESYNPRAFSLQEYKELKSAVDETEKVIKEAATPDIEKLRLVKIIRTAAEELKQKLHSIFVQSCSGPGVQAAQQAASGQAQPPKTGNQNAVDREMTPSSKETSDTTIAPPAAEKEELKLKEAEYINWMPKRDNEGKSADELSNKKQLVDAILADDFTLDVFPNNSEGLFLKRLHDLLHDAKAKEEDSKAMLQIIKAIDKFKEIISKDKK